MSRGYMAQLERLLRETSPPPGKIAVGYVDHAETCPFPQDPRASCSCSPTVTLAWVDRGAA